MQYFLSSVSQGNRNKSKNRQMGPNQAYNILYSKWNHKQNEKATLKLEENVCKQCNQQGLNFHNIQVAHTA